MPGTYNINRLTASGGATIVAQGPVILNIVGQALDPNLGDDPEILVRRLDLRDVTIMSTPSGNPNPANLTIVYWGSGEMDFAGHSHSYAILYAPNAVVKLRDYADWYGAMVVSDLDVPGQTAIHYDLNLDGQVR